MAFAATAVETHLPSAPPDLWLVDALGMDRVRDLDKSDARRVTRVLLARLRDAEEGTREYGRIRAALVDANLALVHHAARRYKRRRDLYEDVVQTGVVGLIKAIDRYDPERGDEFASFALPTITGEIKRFFRDTGWGVHVPRGQQERFLAVTRAQEELRQELGRDGSEQEIAAHLDTTVEDVRLGREAEHAYSVDSLDAVRNRPEGDPGQASTERLGAEEPEFDLVDFKVSVAPLIADLDERDRTILRLRFWGDKTQREIGRELGISQMHVSRLLKRVLDQLRTPLESEHGRAVRV
ncbi:MAG: SigB/SigF/SigG family RNA polymerase sigma factor [Streptomycetaceae bacterium]|nr:SigB/SigF/SigG family RNA polymerase sigma factor [Streptomycetaceae bacterium]